jgi:thiamine-phosphate pyrophosphorylase
MITLFTAMAARVRPSPTAYLGEKMGRLPLRSRLCFVCGGHALGSGLLRAALAGGVGLIHYDGAEQTTREMVQECAELVWACRRQGVPVLVRERADVAQAALADGVHLGPVDMPVAFARRLLGPGAIIGVDCRDRRDAREAQREGASYVAFRPVFADSGPALAELAATARDLTIPFCAYGEITPERAAQLADGPIKLLLVGDAIALAADPEAATRALVQALSAAV